jgi:hypothetical protein
MRPRLIRLIRPLAALGAAATLTVALTQSTTSAAFTATTGDGGNRVSSAPTFCTAVGRVDTPSAVDTGLYQSQPGQNYSTNPTIGVISTAGSIARTLIKFDLSGRPAGCTVQSAILTMRVANGTPGAIVEVYRAAASWNLATVSYSSDPQFIVPGAPAMSVANGNLIQWDVATQVTGLIAGPDYGFEIKFATEGGAFYTQLFDSMDATTVANRPKLSITWR